mgnify:CR=1 FL=1
MSEKLLELRNTTIKFGGVTALNEVNFHVNRGEICALIGPNGAGKTTVFNVVTGVYPVTSGDILFKGESISGKKRHHITKMGLARTFQNVRLFGDMTALENVLTATDVHKKTGLLRALIGTPLNRREERESKARAHELLEFMGIDHRADQFPRRLHRGAAGHLPLGQLRRRCRVGRPGGPAGPDGAPHRRRAPHLPARSGPHGGPAAGCLTRAPSPPLANPCTLHGHCKPSP